MNTITTDTAWSPDPSRLHAPVYRSIAQALEDDIRTGKLRAHDRLPPQRALAERLGVNLTTITRAYRLMEQQGLVYAGVGRGTFVAPGAVGEGLTERTGEGLIELGIIRPFYQCNALVMEAARRVMNRTRTVHLLEYTGPMGAPWQREAAGDWLGRLGISCRSEDIIFASGAQNALAVSVLSLFRPGDMIATDPYTYANFKGLAAMQGICLQAVTNDADGMIPEALENLTDREKRIKGVYLMPSLSNPMGIVMSVKRRGELARVIQKQRLLLIEDDTYGFLHTPPLAPIASMLPQSTVHICGTSKSLCAGLRVAFVTAPDLMRAKILEGMLNINLKTVALNAEIVYELISSGLADQIVRKKSQLAAQRNEIFASRFPHAAVPVCPSFFRWVALDPSMTGEQFEVWARQKGVNILGGHRFMAAPGTETAYARLALTSPDSEEQLARALDVIAPMLRIE